MRCTLPPLPQQDWSGFPLLTHNRGVGKGEFVEVVLLEASDTILYTKPLHTI